MGAWDPVGPCPASRCGGAARTGRRIALQRAGCPSSEEQSSDCRRGCDWGTARTGHCQALGRSPSSFAIGMRALARRPRMMTACWHLMVRDVRASPWLGPLAARVAPALARWICMRFPSSGHAAQNSHIVATTPFAPICQQGFFQCPNPTQSNMARHATHRPLFPTRRTRRILVYSLIIRLNIQSTISQLLLRASQHLRHRSGRCPVFADGILAAPLRSRKKLGRLSHHSSVAIPAHYMACPKKPHPLRSGETAILRHRGSANWTYLSHLHHAPAI
jgi:hypothetical protein